MDDIEISQDTLSTLLEAASLLLTATLEQRVEILKSIYRIGYSAGGIKALGEIHIR